MMAGIDDAARCLPQGRAPGADWTNIAHSVHSTRSSQRRHPRRFLPILSSITLSRFIPFCRMLGPIDLSILFVVDDAVPVTSICGSSWRIFSTLISHHVATIHYSISWRCERLTKWFQRVACGFDPIDFCLFLTAIVALKVFRVIFSVCSYLPLLLRWAFACRRSISPLPFFCVSVQL